MIEQLIHARTQELNRINASWDEKVGTVLSAEVKPEVLDTLSRSGAEGRFLFAAADQRASESFGEDFGPAFASYVFRNPGKYCAATGIRCDDAAL